MAHFNFVISQNAKWGHAGFYIDCHRMTVPENILLQKSTGCVYLQQLWMRSLSTHLNEDRTINMISSSSSKQVRVLYISTLGRSTFVYIKQFYILCLH